MNDYKCIGNLYKSYGAEDLKKSPSGIEYIIFTICVSQGKDGNGINYPPLYINCIAYKSQAKRFLNHSTKGQGFVINGGLKPFTTEGKQTGVSIAVKALYPLIKNEVKNSNGTEDTVVMEEITDEDLPF